MNETLVTRGPETKKDQEILVDMVECIFTKEGFFAILEALGTTIMDLFSGDWYKTGKSIGDLGLITTGVSAGGVLVKKVGKIAINETKSIGKQVAKNGKKVINNMGEIIEDAVLPDLVTTDGVRMRPSEDRNYIMESRKLRDSDKYKQIKQTDLETGKVKSGDFLDMDFQFKVTTDNIKSKYTEYLNCPASQKRILYQEISNELNSLVGKLDDLSNSLDVDYIMKKPDSRLPKLLKTIREIGDNFDKTITHDGVINIITNPKFNKAGLFKDSIRDLKIKIRDITNNKNLKPIQKRSIEVNNEQYLKPIYQSLLF